MKNNWPETVEELLDECKALEGRDLYTLGEKGEPFSGESEPRVNGTDYLAGEYQYGVTMIPAQWVTNVISDSTLGPGTCKQEEGGWSTEGDHARVWLTCGHDCMVETVADLPNFCPICGAKVVSE